MRVLFFITKSEQGGAQTHVAQLCEWLINHGHEIGVMSRPGGWLEKEIRRLGGSFFPNDAITNSANPFVLRRAGKQFLSIVNTFQPDLAACHSTIAGLIGRFSLRNRVPTVFTAHGWGFTQGAPLPRRIILPFLERLAAVWSRRIICVSKNDLELAKTNHIAPTNKLTVVHNGVEIFSLSSSVRKALTDRRNNFDSTHKSSYQSHATHIFFVGRLAPPKNPFLLVEAFVQLPNDIQSHARIIIIGDGPDRERLEQRIAQNGLTNSIELAGSLPRAQVLHRLHNEADLFVLLSHWEGFPYSILEAMASGVPIIASNVGGIPEALEHGGGILVDNNPENVSQALMRLITNAAPRSCVGEQARRSAQANFSVERMCEQTFAQYEQALLQ